MYPHLISVIFKSDGGDVFGLWSIARSYSLPNEERDANGVIAAAIAALVIKDLLELDIVDVFYLSLFLNKK
jgi:hypothetical protein